MKTKTNWYKFIGTHVLWVVFVVNANIDLTFWEKVIVGLAIWGMSQIEGEEE